MKINLILSFLILLVGCQTNEINREKDEVHLVSTENRATEVIATNLNVPWAIVKRQDTFYMTERGGTIAMIENGKATRMNVILNKHVEVVGEGGLLGFVLEPNFPTTKRAFLYHTYKENGKIVNRVVQVKLTSGNWVEEKPLLENIPGAKYHNGGRIAIGPDGKLYVTTGDALIPKHAQQLDSLSGKILRMNLDGSIPQDNPLPNSYVYSYGHRNPQGLAWSDDGKMMFSAEHGNVAQDELNIIEPGKNYGWPVIRGDQTQRGMEPPFLHSKSFTWAPSGIDYRNGKVYIAMLRGEQIMEVDVSTKNTSVLFHGVGRLRDIMIEGETFFTVTSNNDGRGNPVPVDDRLIKGDLTQADDSK